MIKSRSLNFDHRPHGPRRILQSNSVEQIRELIHATRSSHWEPPWASWKCRLGLPYGWEQARDHYGNSYFIDHINHLTTYDDPRQSRAPLGRRTVTVKRHPEMGFGFVAAGQQPTVIQFVSPEGPSEGLLYANDQIIEIEGDDVTQETKDHIVMRVRSQLEELELTVEQLPQKPKSSRRHKVRFTERVAVAAREHSPSDLPPPLPFVLRVFLENGQTRSFRYDDTTTVKNIIDLLMRKLQITKRENFALALEYSLGARSSRLTLLREDTTIRSIIEMPNSDHLRCVLRFAFVPKEIGILVADDVKAFDYFYEQTVGDVIRGRFAMDMRYEACVRLAALQIHQTLFDVAQNAEHISLTKIEKEYGLDRFLPLILIENVKRRELRKHLRFYLKRDSARLRECAEKTLKGDISQSQSSCFSNSDVGLMLRLKYLHVVSHLPSFGGRGFSVTFKESHIDMIMQVDPRCGLLVRHPGNIGQPTISIGFDLIDGLDVCRESDAASIASIRLSSNPLQALEFIVERDDVDDLVCFLIGYHQLAVGQPLRYTVDDTTPQPRPLPKEPPPYYAVHNVISSDWNYTSDCLNEEQELDLTSPLPTYDLATSFNREPMEENEESIHHINTKRVLSSRRKSEDVKILRATDSLLIKASRELHQKFQTSQTPYSGQRDAMETKLVSDSSDTESSWSPLHTSPQWTEDDSLSLPTTQERRASIETLMQSSVNKNEKQCLEDLILQFQGSYVDDEIPDIDATVTQSTVTPPTVTPPTINPNGILANGHPFRTTNNNSTYGPVPQ